MCFVHEDGESHSLEDSSLEMGGVASHQPLIHREDSGPSPLQHRSQSSNLNSRQEVNTEASSPSECESHNQDSPSELQPVTLSSKKDGGASPT